MGEYANIQPVLWIIVYILLDQFKKFFYFYKIDKKKKYDEINILIFFFAAVSKLGNHKLFYLFFIFCK